MIEKGKVEEYELKLEKEAKGGYKIKTIKAQPRKVLPKKSESSPLFAEDSKKGKKSASSIIKGSEENRVLESCVQQGRRNVPIYELYRMNKPQSRHYARRMLWQQYMEFTRFMRRFPNVNPYNMCPSDRFASMPRERTPFLPHF
jgi:hypothetical protein